MLWLKTPSSKWLDAEAVADYFLSILFPAEGRANLDFDRRAALSFLNTMDNGMTPSPLSEMDPDSSAYRTRIRGMVACLMGAPRFQEK